ncbi:MAG TPA: diacylglycerol kinase family protein [Candidatus Lumbricidophila sp.]|nr:diacylglycerol kinase family protein [Candidatus Lumbricidophila sp.]
MTRPSRLVVACNPEAAFGRNRSAGPLVVERLRHAGYDATLISESSFRALQSATVVALDAGADALIVVGGDGMVSLGVNVAVPRGIPLGVVAAGTGNDLARALGLPREPIAGTDALLAALDQPTRTIDVGLIEHAGERRYFAAVLSAGFDAIVNERANRMHRPKGPSRYTFALFRELATFRPRRYRITIDGVVQEHRAMLVSVANGPSLGGGMRIVPQASLVDGLLDVFIVHPLSRIGLLRVFPKVFKGTHVDHPAVEFKAGRRVAIEADSLVVYADGERVGPLPVEITVQPGALRVFVSERFDAL